MLNIQSLGVALFIVGLALIAWVGIGYIHISPLALTMTVLIGVAYAAGAFELLRFHHDTMALAQALRTVPDELPDLGGWLGRLPPSLQNAVRLRIEGERVGLPGPVLTPYLVGLLVLLGMLGTFLGMAVTLNGAVTALESTSDLQAIRSALAAPVRGLGVAFGTSIAGVGASAMLGLMSALCRRARLQTAQLLETRIATTLRGFSRVHQQQETYKALQLQTQALPALADKLQEMMAQMERQSRELNERLVGEQARFYQDAKGSYSQLAAGVGQSLDGWNERLTSEQERFYAEAKASYTGLAAAVGSSLEESLAQSVRQAGEAIQPVVTATMAGIAQETAALQTRLAEAVERQLDGVSTRIDGSVATVAEALMTAITRHERSSEGLNGKLDNTLQSFAEAFEQRSAALLAGLNDHTISLQSELAASDQTRQAALTQKLEAVAASLQQEWQRMGERTLAQQEQLCKTLGDGTREIAASAHAQASSTIAEVAKLMETAAEAPRTAAEVIGELRRELTASTARDNELLTERSRLLEGLDTLLAGIDQTTVAQRQSIDGMVAATTAVLEQASSRFEERLSAESEQMTGVAAQITGGAVEVASLSEAFNHGVQRFAESSDKLMATFGGIDGALEKSAARGDAQLAYYVAQAREIIDLSIMSQRQIIDELQQHAVRSTMADEA